MADSLFAHTPIKSLGHGLNVPGFSLLWRPIKGPKALQKEKKAFAGSLSFGTQRVNNKIGSGWDNRLGV